MKAKKFWKLSPHLPVRDVEETVKWYKENLGFEEEWFYGNPVTDGGCRRDEMRMIFGLGSSPFELPKDISLILFVENVEEVYAEIQQRRLFIFSPLKTYDYGIKEFSIFDCNGYLLRLSESV
jgi:catechol 2,3-dioxygenase-like lactoylglutathione lyase family enzyme